LGTFRATVSWAVLYRPLGSGPIGKLLQRGRLPLSAMANRVSICGNLMLYRPLSTSHGGKTSGGRVAVATTEAMDGVEEKEGQVGVL
jgi:hypothetical protein